MGVLLFVVLFLAYANAVSVTGGLESCDRSDAAIFTCAGRLADFDKDNRISVAELDQAFLSTIVYPAGVTTEMVMRLDYNQDGYVDMTDWNNETRSFYKDRITQTMVCFFCRQNGIAMDLKKRSTNEEKTVMKCDTSDDRFINCVLTLFDANKDNIITPAELTDGIPRLQESSQITTAGIMRIGDVNKDGVLTREGDWDTPKRVFFKTNAEKQMACTFCQRNRINMNV